MELVELLKVFRKHLILIFGLSIFSMVSAICVVWNIEREYAATAKLIVRKSDNLRLGRASVLIGLDSSMSGISVEYVRVIISSDTIAKKVIESLDLLNEPLFTDKKLTYEKMLRKFHKKTEIDDKQYGTLAVKFYSTDPEFAAKVANEIAQQTVDYILQEKLEDSEYLSSKVVAARAELEAIEAKTQQYEEENNIVKINSQLDLHLSSLTQYQRQVVENNATVKGLKRVLESTTNPVLATQTQQKIEELTQLGKVLQSKIDELEARFSSMPEQKREYQEMLRQKAEAVKKLVSLEAMLDMNMTEVDRSAENVKILDRAYATDLPVRPRKILIVMLCTAAGFFLGFFIAVAVEAVRADEEAS